jgi:hypothetical protein
MAAQLIHASGESYGYQYDYDRFDAGRPGSDEAYAEASKDGTISCEIYAVALWASPSELEALELLLREGKHSHRAIREPDAPYHGQLVAIGIEPVVDRNKLPYLIRRLRLVGRRGPVAKPAVYPEDKEK